MINLLKRLGFLIVCSLVMVGLAYGASDIPALRHARDSAERARVQALIDGARAEGKIQMIGVTIEPPYFNHLMEGFKIYYGLPDLKGEFTFTRGRSILYGTAKENLRRSFLCATTLPRRKR